MGDTMIETICQYCNHSFVVPLWYTKRKGHGKFCSKKCSDLAKRVDPVKRFWERVIKPEDPDACWGWTGTKDRRGYGMLWVDGRNVRANRFSYELHKGILPEGMFACHHCDNPSCNNPTHLFAGTVLDNNRDAALKHRRLYGDNNPSRKYPEKRPRGEKHPQAKLTTEQIQAIRTLAAMGKFTFKELSKMFGVSNVSISNYVKGKYRVTG